MARASSASTGLLTTILLLVAGGLLVGTAYASDASPTAVPPVEPVQAQCMHGTVNSVADRLYRDHHNYR
jgi:hypothetical protein